MRGAILDFKIWVHHASLGNGLMSCASPGIILQLRDRIRLQTVEVDAKAPTELRVTMFSLAI
jgi:hypothetical protein